MMYSARWRTGERTVRSSLTASSREWAELARGWLRRVSLYRLMMASTLASTKRILYSHPISWRASRAENSPSKV